MLHRQAPLVAAAVLLASCSVSQVSSRQNDAASVDAVDTARADAAGSAPAGDTSPPATDMTEPAPSDGPVGDAVVRPGEAVPSATPPGPDLPPTTCASCAGFEPKGTLRGRVADPDLNELSGLAASRRHPGVLYAQNDDDDRLAQFFALSDTGAALGRFVLQGPTRKKDTEEIALGPCPTGTCIYLADAGDGGAKQAIPVRTEYAIFRIPEPEVEVGAPRGLVTDVPFERFRFAYPDGSHDSEAMLVDPRDATIYVITKVASGPAVVYRLPNPPDPEGLNLAVEVASLSLPKRTASDSTRVTAASVHPCGDRFLLLTYSLLFEFRAPPGGSLETALAASPTRMGAVLSGEAVTYRATGEGFLTAAEGVMTKIVEVGCARP